jgi:hypothetical protein
LANELRRRPMRLTQMDSDSFVLGHLVVRQIKARQRSRASALFRVSNIENVRDPNHSK